MQEQQVVNFQEGSFPLDVLCPSRDEMHVLIRTKFDVEIVKRTDGMHRFVPHVENPAFEKTVHYMCRIWHGKRNIPVIPRSLTWLITNQNAEQFFNFCTVTCRFVFLLFFNTRKKKDQNLHENTIKTIFVFVCYYHHLGTRNGNIKFSDEEALCLAFVGGARKMPVSWKWAAACRDSYVHMYEFVQTLRRKYDVYGSDSGRPHVNDNADMIWNRKELWGAFMEKCIHSVKEFLKESSPRNGKKAPSAFVKMSLMYFISHELGVMETFTFIYLTRVKKLLRAHWAAGNNEDEE
jgi:hypothetical protein